MPENNFENNDSAGRDLNPEARSHEAAAREIRETADAPAGSHQKDLGGLSTGVMMEHFVADVAQTPVAATDSRSAEGAPVSLWLSLIHISEPTRRLRGSRMPSSA